MGCSDDTDSTGDNKGSCHECALAEDLETGRVTATLTMLNGYPAAIGLLVPIEDGVRQLQCGFTHPACRGYGAWSATLDRRIQQCRVDGVAARAIVDPRTVRVRRALERRGFVLDDPPNSNDHVAYLLSAL